jgi:hypothetical protein
MHVLGSYMPFCVGSDGVMPIGSHRLNHTGVAETKVFVIGLLFAAAELHCPTT